MHQPRSTRLLVVLAAVLALAGAGAVMAGARGTPRERVVTGRGTWLAGHTDFVGYYRAWVDGHWVTVYCVSPDKRAPTAVRLHPVERLPAVGAEATREVAQTLSAHGEARTLTEAEAVSQALNEEMGNHAAVARRAPQLPAGVRELAARYVAEARAQHAPYTLELHLPSSPLPGQAGTGAVTLRGGGHGVAATVKLRHTPNVELPERLRLDSRGRASFTYRTIGGGPVHVAASTSVPPAGVLASQPDHATQLMITWAAPATAHATATYQGSGPRFSYRYACSNVCDGHPTVSLTACAPASGYASRITYWFGDAQHSEAFDASAQRTCSTWQQPIADGVTVSATWQYHAARGWTPPIPAGGAFVVDCPAAPPVAVLLSYDCTHAALRATLGSAAGASITPLHNATRHPMLLLVAGAVSGRFVVPPGGTAVAQTFTLSCGMHANVTVTGAVQRGDGSYNLGQPATVVTP
jgi:hypothetical protein